MFKVPLSVYKDSDELQNHKEIEGDNPKIA
jgi:hypothetical protein